MIFVYGDINGELRRTELEAHNQIPEGTVWIDLLEPDAKEEIFIEKLFGIDIPTLEEMDRIEVMSPFYQESGNHYMTVTLLDGAGLHYLDSSAATFILTKQYLFTLRYSKSRSFNNFSAKAIRMPSLYNSPELILTGLIKSIINKIADVLEDVGNELDALLKAVFDKPKKQMTPNYYNQIIRKIGSIGNTISKNRESLVSIHRMLIYFSQIDEKSHSYIKKDNKSKLKLLIREVHSLTEYANFVSQRSSFLLDATLGMISVEQNMIIKAFTVAAAAFMPPTLVASIYGMNFKFMPELDLWFGYPLALLLIVISALIPYILFKKKGWL